MNLQKLRCCDYLKSVKFMVLQNVERFGGYQEKQEIPEKIYHRHAALSQLDNNALIISFPAGRPPGHPGELFFVTNKSHSNPLGKGHKVNEK